MLRPQPQAQARSGNLRSLPRAFANIHARHFHGATGIVGRLAGKEDTMNTLILCTAVTLNIFSAPAGNQVVGTVPANKEVQLMDGSLLRDWVFIGKPGPDGVSPRGWVIYAGLGQCQ